jgi:hypothetical protein
MFAKVEGDYTKFPAEIRDAMPIIEGEVHELRIYWEVYHTLFMKNEEKTKLLDAQFGPMLHLFQVLLGSQMILSISCLTDDDNKYQQSLSLSLLKKAVPVAKDKNFGAKVDDAYEKIKQTVAIVRQHRNKHIAHFDLNVALGHVPLDEVLLSELKSSLEQMEKFLNLFKREFENIEVGYENLSCDMITESAICTAFKAKFFD